MTAKGKRLETLIKAKNASKNAILAKRQNLHSRQATKRTQNKSGHVFQTAKLSINKTLNGKHWRETRLITR